MANTIWKTPDQKPEKTGNIVYVLEDGYFGNFFYIEGKDFPTVAMANQFCFITEDTPIKMVKWTYLADLITQANKAELLQKGGDLAVDVLKDITFCKQFDTVTGVRKYADSKLEEITNLIKGKNNDR